MASSSPSGSDEPVAAPRPTPLYDVHKDLGASLTDFAGWSMPLRYASETAEHRAVRDTAGLFDLSHMGEIEVTGPDAVAALDHALVGNMAKLTVGRARYTMICAPDGGVLDDLIVYRLADDRLLIVANAANTAVVLDAVTERAAHVDAAVTDRTAGVALLAVQGPAAVDIITPLTDAPLADLKYYAGHPAAVAGHRVLLARTGYTGEDGFELFCAGDGAVDLWRRLADAGASHGLIPAGLAARDTLRLEAGMPLYGNELSRDVTPYEAGLGRVVKLDKPGDFVGKGALRERSDAGPRRTLIGLVTRGRRVPRHGYPVLVDGRPCGEVTSGAPSPTLGKPIAMAYVDTDRVSSPTGAEYAVDVRGRAEPADRVDLPFYRRNR